MKGIIVFFRNTFVGGFLVVLPLTILFIVFRWLVNLVTGFLQPITHLILSQFSWSDYLANIVAFAVVLILFFLIGFAMSTRFGRFLWGAFERHALMRITGYKLIKDIIDQLKGNYAGTFSEVALVNLFSNDTLATAFITDRHPDGSFTVFVPTGPNPTSGLIYHLRAEYVHPVKVPVETAMKSIVSCGIGSQPLMQAMAEDEMKKSGSDVPPKPEWQDS
jgi:uncharacterized membrane protein